MIKEKTKGFLLLTLPLNFTIEIDFLFEKLKLYESYESYELWKYYLSLESFSKNKPYDEALGVAQL